MAAALLWQGSINALCNWMTPGGIIKRRFIFHFFKTTEGMDGSNKWMPIMSSLMIDFFFSYKKSHFKINAEI